ncbi:hypothetical protein L914_02843 [Phytophthora nicotianae]|uniref:Uncharacterized protein n=2 Tax=Phytophthora nicotianae TaxID=4792 RepID=V9FUQ6_PHYNI|nr:hypothetical protein F443_03014 [Phytophthora nicotianae P1569]ETM53702.1 hypothetical protein L914_02843 [Phytophthora nicotianae]
MPIPRKTDKEPIRHESGQIWNNGYVVGRVTQTDIATLRESVKETEWEIADGFWHALTSLTGGDAQAAHKDFPTFETAHAQLRKGMPPAFVIMAFMGETPLHTHPGRFGPTVDMPKRKGIAK